MTVAISDFTYKIRTIGPSNSLRREGGSTGMTEISLGMMPPLPVFDRIRTITFFAVHKQKKTEIKIIFESLYKCWYTNYEENCKRKKPATRCRAEKRSRD
jgi:hypothetical protein